VIARRVRALELFAGGGGAALGLRSAGLESLGCVESDADACATLRSAGFPAIESDVRSVDWAPLRDRADLVWASPPCQAFSTAGPRLGASDPRNGWPWTLDAIDAVAPTWVICENVPGLTYHSAGCRGASAATCAGCYWSQWVVPGFRSRFRSVQTATLDAADYGVPQHRRRVFLIAGPHPIRWPAPTHGAAGQLGLFAAVLPWVSCGEALGLSKVIHEPSTTIAARAAGNAGPFVVRRSQDPSVPLARRAIEEIGDRPSPTISATYGKSVTPDGNAPGGVPFIAVSGQLVGMGSPGPAITANGSHHYVGVGVLGGPWWHGRRRLTVAECATLQGFPQRHRFHGSQTSQYKQIGNAVPPSMARVLAEAVVASF